MSRIEWEEIEVFPCADPPEPADFQAQFNELLGKFALQYGHEFPSEGMLRHPDPASGTIAPFWEHMLKPYQLSSLFLYPATGEAVVKISFGLLSDEYPVGLVGSGNLWWKLEDLEAAGAGMTGMQAYLNEIRRTDWLFEVSYARGNPVAALAALAACLVLGRSGDALFLHPETWESPQLVSALADMWLRDAPGFWSDYLLQNLSHWGKNDNSG